MLTVAEPRPGVRVGRQVGGRCPPGGGSSVQDTNTFHMWQLRARSLTIRLIRVDRNLSYLTLVVLEARTAQVTLAHVSDDPECSEVLMIPVYVQVASRSKERELSLSLFLIFRPSREKSASFARSRPRSHRIAVASHRNLVLRRRGPRDIQRSNSRLHIARRTQAQAESLRFYSSESYSCSLSLTLSF